MENIIVLAKVFGYLYFIVFACLAFIWAGEKILTKKETNRGYQFKEKRQ